MKNLTRITVALDEQSIKILDRLAKDTGMSYSSLVRNAIKSFSHGSPEDAERARIWSALLSKGEHVILDVDHYLLFLKYIDSSGSREDFYREGKRVALSHAEQLLESVRTPEEYLKRLEACNLFKLVGGSGIEYTLVLSSDISKRFITELVSTTMSGMGFKFQIREDLAKIRIKLNKE